MTDLQTFEFWIIMFSVGLFGMVSTVGLVTVVYVLSACRGRLNPTKMAFPIGLCGMIFFLILIVVGTIMYTGTGSDYAESLECSEMKEAYEKTLKDYTPLPDYIQKEYKERCVDEEDMEPWYER